MIKGAFHLNTRVPIVMEIIENTVIIPKSKVNKLPSIKILLAERTK